MVSPLAKARSSVRHRIQEITLSPTPSSYPIELEVLIDNAPLYELPEVAPGSPLLWNLESYPCDVQPDSKIKLKIIEKHFPSPRNRIGYLEYLVPDVIDKPAIHLQVDNPASQLMGFSSTAKRWDHGEPFAVSLTFPDCDRVDNAYLVALDKADAIMSSKIGPLEGLGKFRDLFKTLIDVGQLVAEMNSSAKLVVGVCSMVWEHLEKLQRLHDDLRKLLKGLENIIQIVEFVKEYATNSLLGDTITALLRLIEDSSNFMLGYFSKRAPVRLLRSTFDGSAPDRVGELLQEFTDLRDEFDRKVRVQVLATVITSTQRALIDRLNPAAQSHYANTSTCQSGTREQVLNGIYQWVNNQNPTEKLLWLYGYAGQGKSSIAASICMALDGEETLGAHFFCKRDDPDLRSPGRILNTIIHRLAMKYKAYGHSVSSAIDNNTELPNSPLQNRYSKLVEKPLQALALNKRKQSGLLVLIVDALDECDKGDGRRFLLTYLRSLSILVPWIKVIVTSRPDQDIKDVFGESNDSTICARNIHNYNASDDIYAYIRKQMTDVANAKKRTDWPDDTVKLLSQRADGLFIWAATACRFISGAVNVNQSLNQVLEGTGSSGSSDGLDELYATAIRRSMDREDQDNIECTRQCIAAIVATTSRTPLSVSALEALLCDKFGDGTFRGVVSHLGSVLYEDKDKGNVVRVYHPSFADYVTNPARSKEFHVTIQSINTTLADCCLSRMLRELRFNICGLETSHLLNREVPNLEGRVRSAIGEYLEYSCVHWSSHLTVAPKGALSSQLGEFLLGPVLLFWIEALSLLSRLNVALSSLQEIKDWTLSIEGSHATCAHDAYRFVLAFYDAISESTPHLYTSALPFTPKKSLIAERIRPLFPNTLRIAEGADEHWSACLHTISLGEAISSAAISPDGSITATSCPNGVQLWEAETGRPASSLLECSSGDLAFSHDGRLLFCHQNSGGIKGWNIETLEPVLMNLPATSESSSLIAISCNNLLAISSPNEYAIAIWDLRSGTAVFELVGASSEIESIVFSPNGRLIASAFANETMYIWDADTGATLFNQPGDAASIAFSPDSRYMASALWEGTVQIWDTLTYTSTMELQVALLGTSCVVAYSPNGRSIAVGFGDAVRIWDLDAASTSPAPLLGHTNILSSLMFSPNGHHVISSSYDGTVRIWDVDTQTTALPLRAGHSDWVNHVVFSPNGVHVLSASNDKTMGTWDVNTGQAVCDPIVSPIESRCLSISPDCRRVATEGNQEDLHIWDIGSATSTALSGTDFTFALAFSSDGLRVTCAFERSKGYTLQVNDTETGAELLAPIATGQDSVDSVAYSPCGRFIASGDSEGGSGRGVCVWSAESGVAVGKPLSVDVSVGSIRFSPDGRHIAAGSDSLTRVYEVETGTLVHEFPTPDDSICALAFSPNGRRLASGSFNQSIHVWDTELDIPTSELLLGHTYKVTSVAFSHDGSLLASGSFDCTVRIWDATNTNTTILASLDHLTSVIYPTLISSDAPHNASQVTSVHPKLLDLTFSTSRLAHRLREGGWVSLTDGTVLLWLLPDYRVIDQSIFQVSARHLPRYSIDFSNFVHGDRWTSVASDSIRHYNCATQ